MNMLVRLLIVVLVAALLYWGVPLILAALTLPANVKTIIYVLVVFIGCFTAAFYVCGTPSGWNWRGPNPPA